MWNRSSICTCVAFIGILLSAYSFFSTKNYEESLLIDWSDPPPYPIFVLCNVLAGVFQSLADALTPPPIQMFDIGFAYQMAVLAYICQKFTIPDFLAEDNKPKTIPEIAKHMQTKDTNRVERLMFALASEGMTKLDKSGTMTEPRFVNTALSATLRRDHPNSVAGWLGHNFQETYPSWEKLPDLFGPNPIHLPWDEAFPKFKYSKGGVWKFYESNPDNEEQFGRAMQSIESLGGTAMAIDAPFYKFDRFIDVGGSHGHFLHKVMKQNPKMKGVLMDRPNVISNAKTLWGNNKNELDTSSPVHLFNDIGNDRITFVSGDFFVKETIPVAISERDMYHLRYILHDWDDAKVETILKNIRHRIGNTNATLMVGECAMPERHSVGIPATIHHIDMQMMVMFPEAKERTPSQWKITLANAGFKLNAIYSTRSLVHYVEAVPV